MKAELNETLWLNERLEFSLAEFVELSGLSEKELRELVDYGALEPTNPQAEDWTFSAQRVISARTACRLRKDFGLDLQGLALILIYLDKIHELEAQLHDLRARLPRWLR
ncbi:MAG TPA: chaperone modulator CbpM [Burkholderiales bacterium]|nr:chaperone modulator CbpM [Burkholderiales bacterium]